jgi:hypothetical protein
MFDGASGGRAIGGIVSQRALHAQTGLLQEIEHPVHRRDGERPF